MLLPAQKKKIKQIAERAAVAEEARDSVRLFMLELRLASCMLNSDKMQISCDEANARAALCAKEKDLSNARVELRESVQQFTVC